MRYENSGCRAMFVTELIQVQEKLICENRNGQIGIRLQNIGT